VIVGDADDLICEEFEIDRVNWHPVAGIDGLHPSPAASASPLAEGERTEVRGFPSRNGKSRQPSPHPLPCEERGGRTQACGEDDPRSSFNATVKIRYSHPGTSSTVTPLENNRARIRLHEPQRAVTPGQAAVIYDGDVVIGGGWICRPASTRHPEPRKLSGSKEPAAIT
jgi:hypothetical protein